MNLRTRRFLKLNSVRELVLTTIFDPISMRKLCYFEPIITDVERDYQGVLYITAHY